VNTLLLIVYTILFLAAVLLDKAYKTVSVKELKRRAKSGRDKGSSSIYKLVALGGSLKLFLWLVGSLSAAGILLEVFNHSKILAAVVLIFGTWLALSDMTLKIGGIFWKLAALISIPAFKLINLLHPVLSGFSKFFSKVNPVAFHTGLYDKEDLLELLSYQNHQVDNRISEQDLKIASGALTFGDKLVRDIMTPRRAVKLVYGTDTIGPLLMDELHASGYSQFPVVNAPTKESTPQIVGTLYFKDLIEHQDRGKVSEVMQKGARHINENKSLRDALNIFLKSQHHLLIVVNNFEEITGVISLEDVMEQIIGQQITGELDGGETIRLEEDEGTKKEQKLHNGE
jgi:CBS domain containing-hemolysin-like protein